MIKTETLSNFLKGVLRSYSQIFFSDDYWFALPLVLVSFLDISAGFAGLLSVFTANIAASLLKFDKETTSKGYYGFNSLLVGLGLGYFYELTLVIVVIAIIAGFIFFIFSYKFTVDSFIILPVPFIASLVFPQSFG